MNLKKPGCMDFEKKKLQENKFGDLIPFSIYFFKKYPHTVYFLRVFSPQFINRWNIQDGAQS